MGRAVVGGIAAVGARRPGCRLTALLRLPIIRKIAVDHYHLRPQTANKQASRYLYARSIL